MKAGSSISDLPAARFRAFLSYSHADARQAARLHRRLEAFRLPGRLRGAGPNATGRIGPIFRDREDLPAAQDLSESVRAALAVSDTLVVVCSPDARASRWVGLEIETFRALHPGRPILAAIVRDEPRLALPESLLVACEPLAADLRKQADGHKLGLLKIVAGIADVPLDALIQRDAQRRLKRVIAVTLASATGMVAAVSMSIFAIQSRNEAQRQRGKAEGLVEYMLTDLRKELRAVGRLDVMEGVNQRALNYYGDQGPPADLPDDSLQRRARVIGAMGEDAENAGNLDLAQAHYEVLHKTTAALLRKDPRDPERQLAHARSENRLALLSLTRGRRAEALNRFRRTRDMLHEIRDWGQGNPVWVELSGFANGNICATSLTGGDASGATLSDCERAVSFNRRLVAMRPQDGHAAYDLVFHLLWLADAQSANGQIAQARATRMLCLEATDDLVAQDPANMLWREQQMEVYVRYAEWLRDAGQGTDARTVLRRARDIAGDLVARDPANARWSQYSRQIQRKLDGG